MMSSQERRSTISRLWALQEQARNLASDILHFIDDLEQEEEE